MLWAMPGAWIVFASLMLGPPPPQISEGPEGIQEGPAAPTLEDPTLWPDPGTAPANGAGMFVAAGVTLPVGVLVPLGLLQEPALTDADRIGIIGVAAGMGLIGSLGWLRCLVRGAILSTGKSGPYAAAELAGNEIVGALDLDRRMDVPLHPHPVRIDIESVVRIHDRHRQADRSRVGLVQ
jgi:hypothetical protein